MKKSNKVVFPANVIHDGSDEVVSLFPYTEKWKGNKGGSGYNRWIGVTNGEPRGEKN